MMAYLFWLLVFLIGYTYLLYPAILKILANPNPLPASDLVFEPSVSIIVPAHNEEIYIQRKIESIFDTHYPLAKIELLICSDGSNDQTENIILRLAKLYPQLHYISHPDQKGKSFTVNKLVEAATHEIILLTDANIIFDPNTIGENVKNYADQKVGLVASLVINQTSKAGDLMPQEKRYVSWENTIKYREGLIWGCTIAPFGACLSFKKDLFVSIPEHFLVDDFFIATQVLKQKKRCVLEKKSICYEDLTGSLKAEFKRRKRISTGNFQNLAFFFPLFSNVFSPVGFCFWSHKGLRWLSPFFLLLILGLNFLLLQEGWRYLFLFILQLFYYCTTLTLYLRPASKPANNLVKFAHYFMMMNIALLMGFFHFIKGVKVGYWEVTERRN